MHILLKRAYVPAERSDGYRVLVDRLWPRGVSKQDARIDLWAKEAAPSNELRRWFAHEPQKWSEFKQRYFDELAACPEALEQIIGRARRGRVTFVYSSRETRFNNAVALQEYLSPSTREA